MYYLPSLWYGTYLFMIICFVQELGYCPQFDCVWKTITVREHLETYAAIRGVPRAHIPGLVKRYTFLFVPKLWHYKCMCTYYIP